VVEAGSSATVRLGVASEEADPAVAAAAGEREEEAGRLVAGRVDEHEAAEREGAAGCEAPREGVRGVSVGKSSHEGHLQHGAVGRVVWLEGRATRAVR